jgi:hypothetical protein
MKLSMTTSMLITALSLSSAVAVPLLDALNQLEGAQLVLKTPTGDQDSSISLYDLISSIVVIPQTEDTVDDLGRRKKKKKKKSKKGNHGDDETLVEVSVTTYVEMTIELDDLTTAEEIFLQDALLFSYNQVHGASDFSGLSSHLVAKGKVPNGDNSLRGENNLQAYGDHYPAWIVYYMSMRCRFCKNTDDDHYLADEGADTVTDTLLTAVMSPPKTHRAWEDAFCDQLVGSKYDAFSDAVRCKIMVDRSMAESSAY